MVEQLEKKNMLVVPNQATVELPKESKTEPKKENVPRFAIVLVYQCICRIQGSKTGCSKNERFLQEV